MKREEQEEQEIRGRRSTGEREGVRERGGGINTEERGKERIAEKKKKKH